MTQLVIKTPDDLARRIDRFVEAGRFESRSSLARAALEQLLARLDAEADALAYVRQPLGAGEVLLSDGRGIDPW